ncbi:MAG: hypothetical protein E6370_08835 [Clostridiales bacterium]|nr:hypothetical protein [Clostridiales bacterium]MDU6854472.1 hypothetical protein [Clostridiales bacterium]MDU6974417.1 hypothetical protein [Clostridiales bacterium]
MPYIYLSTDQTQGYIVNQSKTGEFNVTKIVPQKENNRTEYIIWEIS